MSVRACAAAVVMLGLAACANGAVTSPSPSVSSAPVASMSPSAATPAAATTATPTASGTSVASSPAATTTPSASPTPSASVTGQGRTTTMVFSGDLLWHNTLWISAAEDRKRTGKGTEFDFDPMFAAIKPTIEGADLAVCHEEVPFAKQGGPYTGYPSFNAPPAIAPWIKTMGWDACTVTSNHSLDGGMTGLLRTHSLLSDNGVVPIGTFTSAADRATPKIVPTADGVKVALIGSTYGLNGNTVPEGKEWAVSMVNVPDLLAQAKRARQAGADIVIVQLHAGDEYAHKPNKQQIVVAAALTASPDVDAVVGEHVHVVQPITKVNGKWVVYGMGNMVAQHRSNVPRGAEGITVRLTAVEKPGGGFEVTTVDYIPTLITHYSPGNPARLYPVVDTLGKGVGPTARLKVARTKISDAVLLLGTTPGLTER